MAYRMVLTFVVIALGGFLTSCTHKERPSNRCLFLVGGDTVSISMVNRLVPDSLPWPKKLRRAALEYALAYAPEKASPRHTDSPQVKQIGSDLAQQLSRQTSETWTPEAGRILYISAQFIAERAWQTSSLSMARSCADSLFSALVVVYDSSILQEIRMKKASSLENAIIRRNDPASLEPLVSFLFDLPSPASRIVCEFVATAEKEPTAVADMSSAIKGLVFDSTRDQVKKSRQKAAIHAAVVPDNSKEALRFRSQGSIKDSIEKHIPNLEVLYKKHLKVRQNVEGTVWVTFHINPDGSVINAQIKTSSITDKNFLIPFRDYVVQKIHFQSIPEKVGTMSVEFPFEFAPEN
jgi:TonB family protein